MKECGLLRSGVIIILVSNENTANIKNILYTYKKFLQLSIHISKYTLKMVISYIC